MADNPVLTGRRAQRNVKLVKPPPLKRSVSEQVTNSNTNNNTNIAFQGVRAPRRTNLEKPLPRSKSTPEELNDHSWNQPCDETQYSGMSPNTAKTKADCLISDVLSHLELQDKFETVKPNFRTQMSVDSGVGDCNNNSFSSSLCIGRKDSINEVLFDDGFNEYPEEILTIEEELASLVDSNTDTESVSERDEIDRSKQRTVIEPGLPQFVIEPSVPCSVVGPNVPIIHRRKKCVIERAPISPATVLFRDQHDMTEDILTANGRRRMFRLYHNSCAADDNTSDDEGRKRIQYTANKLLEIGTSPLSKRPVNGWEYLVHILPEICFPRVDKYFDTASYRQERDYVMKSANVVGPKSTHLRNDHPSTGRHPLKPAIQFSDRPTTTFQQRNGFGAPALQLPNRPTTTLRPQNGFGIPFKNNFSREPQLDIQSSEEIPDQTDSSSTNHIIETACNDPQGLFINHSKPSEICFKPSENHSKPSDNHSKPSDNHSQIQKVTFIDQNFPTKYEDLLRKSRHTSGQKRKVDLRMNASNVDLDTKCDVSVKWDSGAIKLFANARQDLKKSREKQLVSSNNKSDTIQLPTQIDGSQYSRNPEPCVPPMKTSSIPPMKTSSIPPMKTSSIPPMKPSSIPPMKPNRQKYYEEDYYFNADLPEKCPW